ncbi:MAG: Crp/Fnr family transcriptional regulator [Capnocytophaga sp.]|nr:Crp/Fnr family transcriptional regulator [Capnocytophaga sp.]
MPYISDYLQTIKLRCSLISQEALDYFASGLSVSELKAKEFFLQNGDIQPYMGYVLKGLLRIFYTSEKGDEVTLDFLNEGNIASHCAAFLHNTPSRFSYQCVEDAVIVNIPYLHYKDCCEKFPAFDKYFRENMENELERYIMRTESFLLDNAETRYLNFIRQRKDIFNRIPLTMLCSYLGVSRQALTQIRKKILLRQNDKNLSGK